MQSIYEEELKALRTETLPRPTKQPHDEPGHGLGKYGDPLRDNWRMPIFNKYDSSTDPDEHIRINLSPNVVMYDVITTLRFVPFSIQNLDELRKRVVNFMWVEEIIEFRKQMRVESPISNKGDIKLFGKRGTRSKEPIKGKKTTPPNVDGNKHCLYIRNLGHTTKECVDCEEVVHLEREAEDLVDVGNQFGDEVAIGAKEASQEKDHQLLLRRGIFEH
ncbi:hypothetical protein V8G54_007040 [Vigna mungo]|uniref:Uncharacterized protein n=1 Tax=Vigna mungo TaxID=3915 RepID=A0AAQ3P4L2_VIGMU